MEELGLVMEELGLVLLEQSKNALGGWNIAQCLCLLILCRNGEGVVLPVLLVRVEVPYQVSATTIPIQE